MGLLLVEAGHAHHVPLSKVVGLLLGEGAGREVQDTGAFNVVEEVLLLALVGDGPGPARLADDLEGVVGVVPTIVYRPCKYLGAANTSGRGAKAGTVVRDRRARARFLVAGTAMGCPT